MEFNIDITATAREKIAEQLQKRGKGVGIRIGVKTTGCSGYSYVLEWVDDENVKSDDQVLVLDNLKIFINKKYCDILQNLQMDWIKEGLNAGFKFINPLERDRCGCGLSFRI